MCGARTWRRLEMKSNGEQSRRLSQALAWAVAFVLLALPISALAEPTHIVPPKNGYSPQDDVRAGQQAAAEAERQLPILNDRDVTDYVNRVGFRLVDAIPE